MRFSMAKIPHRLYLTEEQMPKQWYNMRADMPEQPDPMLNPATGKPVTEQDLYPVSAKNLHIRRWTAKPVISTSPSRFSRST